jgi:hypothetical protein
MVYLIIFAKTKNYLHRNSSLGQINKNSSQTRRKIFFVDFYILATSFANQIRRNNFFLITLGEPYNLLKMSGFIDTANIPVR